MRQALWISAFLALGVLASGAPAVLSHLGRSDPGDLYLLFAWDRDLHSDVKEIGPTRAPLARMIEAAPQAHKMLVAQGYWVLPASRIAALCGVAAPRSERT